MKEIHIYLVSDSTGETVCSVSRSAMAHFQNVKVHEHLWSFVQTKGKLTKLESALNKNQGVVMYTIADKDVRKELKNICKNLGILCIPVLSRVINDLSSYLHMQTIDKIGKQHELNDEYFLRMEAVNFAITHDDGQLINDLEKADIILVGVSRTSKSPTSLYLAQKGLKTANIPYVSENVFPAEIHKLQKPLIVGLSIRSEILVEVRKKRILSYRANQDSSYVNLDEVENEIRQAKRFYQLNNWPIIDVSRRSVEETAALVLQLYEKDKIRKQRS